MLVDASCCMLFEASGDSESAYYDAAELDAAAAEDDAESCSSGGVVVDGALGDAGVDDDSVEGGGAELEGQAAAAEMKGCEDSNVKLMSEGDTDRLFWEACLAS